MLLLGVFDKQALCEVEVFGAIRKMGGLPVLCEPRESTYFSRLVVQFLPGLCVGLPGQLDGGVAVLV